MNVNNFLASQMTASIFIKVLLRLGLGVQVLCVVMVGLSSASLAQTPQTADEYLKRGNDYRNNNDYEKAIADYTEAVRLDPQLAGAFLNRAVAHFHLKDYDAAIADSTQAIKINPHYAEAYHNRGTAYGSKGSYAEALADIDQALKINPQLAEAYFSRGVINNAFGENDLAIADYTRAVKLDPQQARAYHNRGLGYYRNKDYDLAISDFTQVVSLAPNEFMGYWARGGVYADKKEYDLAVADLTKAISLAPGDTKLYSKRAEVYCAQGKKDLATADEKKIIELGGSLVDKCSYGDTSRPLVPESSSTPRFEDYPATQKPKGMPATAIIANKRARQYRTAIRRDAEAGPNFAGNYTIAQWGCGSTCVAFAIVDGHTGRVYFHPQVLQAMQVPFQAENVIQFRPDSRLLVISGEILPLDPDKPTGPESVGRFYYEWKNNQLKLIRKAEIKLEAGAPIDQLNVVCVGIDNSYECAQAIERHQLQKAEYASAAIRAATSLRLQLRNGRTLPVNDFQKRGEEASVVKYSFRDHLRDIGYFLLHRQFYEGDGYLMIQESTGRKFELQDLPVISPDKLRVVTASNGISGGYNANAVQIWRLSKRGMVLEQTISPKGWGPSDAEWTDSLTIRVMKTLPDTGESEATNGTATLRFRGRWQLQAVSR